MLKTITFTAICALALAFTVPAQPAFARNGEAIAAGVIGAAAAGAIVNSQYDRNYYDGPGYYEHSSYRHRGCHIERRLVVNRYGHEHIRRIRVCD